ncbi:MAG TPA: glycosyltransferase family 39 protein [Bryobacteraceae bacterium]|nr:glycosyltransferase family 39 protein [Bryobacteraceae bacterium]
MTFRTRLGMAAVLLLFILSAIAFVSRPGIEADEALVAVPGIYALHSLPLMDMSYLGALKQWFYMALFAFVKPGPASLRVPTILVGAIALWLFFRLLDRTVGRAAAWIGTILLATDSMYVILEAIDYGPNALHFGLKLGAMLLLVRFHLEPRARWLAAAFFLLGLGLWDKAIFAWVLFGIGIATLAVFPREVRSHLTSRNLAIASASLIVGALPLVIYNIARPLDTFRSNVHLSNDPLAHKVDLLERTLSGFALFDFFTSVDPPPHPGEATTRLQKLSRAVSEAAHHPTRNITIPALCIACLGLFARASRKPVLFGLLACAGTWLPMVLTAGAGGAAHHVILLFPFQYLSIAAALAAVPWRAAAVAATMVLCSANLALTNEYYWELVHNGPDIRWSDALYPLEHELERLRSPNIYIADWGFYESLVLLSDNTIPLHELEWTNAEALRRAFADPRFAFVAHTAKFAYLPQERAALEDAASNEGYEEVPIETIYDRNGRPTFEVFRFRKIPL